MMAAISSANTIANPAELPSCSISSTGKQRYYPERDRAARPQNVEKIESS